MAALRCSKIPAKIFSTFVNIRHVLSQIPYQRKTETSHFNVNKPTVLLPMAKKILQMEFIHTIIII